jgi:uncharacterized membrane protein YtjA (UPF0391 family)
LRRANCARKTAIPTGLYRNEGSSSLARLLKYLITGRLVRPAKNFRSRSDVMLHYALVFLVVALIAAALGFGGIAGAAAGIAKLLFLVFIVLFLISLIAGGVRGRRL